MSGASLGPMLFPAGLARSPPEAVAKSPGTKHGDGPSLHMILNHFVEDVQNHGTHFELVTRNTLDGQHRTFRAVTVVLAAGSIESPKLLRRFRMFPCFPDHVKAMIGRGLADHPTSSEITTFVTNIGDVPIPKNSHAKIILYSRGYRDGSEVRFPFNVEMDVNHEYWHLRENDPTERGCRTSAVATPGSTSSSASATVSMTPTRSRLRPTCKFGEGGKGFGWGTVHHAAGSLGMPYRRHLGAPFAIETIVDDDLRVAGTQHLYVCDMSVMPFSSAANPVRTVVALALRLSRHFG